MPHIPPPYCPADVLTPFTFTNDPLTANVSKAEAIDRNELDTFVTEENTRRGLLLTPLPSTDVPAVTDSTKWKAVHINELRSALEYMNNPTEQPSRSCPTNSDAYCPANTSGWCPTDTVGPTISWTNPTITANQSLVSAVDVTDARTNLNLEAVSCVCEQEACNFCSDCGYHYTYITCPGDTPGCRCDDHLAPECACQQTVDVWSCATINTPGSWVQQVAPWNCMCNFTPPGISWGTWNPPHAPGYPHPEWGCMCSPYNWG